MKGKSASGFKPCPICGKGIIGMRRRSSHMRRVHPDHTHVYEKKLIARCQCGKEL